MNLTNNTIISHFNKLEGIDRILADLYGAALRASKQDRYDAYAQKLLNAILAVASAQRELPWSPAPVNPESTEIPR